MISLKSAEDFYSGQKIVISQSTLYNNTHEFFLPECSASKYLPQSLAQINIVWEETTYDH